MDDVGFQELVFDRNVNKALTREPSANLKKENRISNLSYDNTLRWFVDEKRKKISPKLDISTIDPLGKMLLNAACFPRK